MSVTTPGGVPVGHADHGLTAEHLAFVDQVLAEQPEGFFVVCRELPAELPAVPSALYGPSAGDEVISEEEVTYKKRGDRPGPSRLIDRPTRPCRSLVVIGIAGDQPRIFTAYGGPCAAPREWWDASMRPAEAVEAARFWSEHALAAEA